MPTKVTIESGTTLEKQYRKALERIAERVRMKHPQWRWRKGAQLDPPPVSEKVDGKKGKKVY
jgi:hypothetical protein